MSLKAHPIHHWTLSGPPHQQINITRSLAGNKRPSWYRKSQRKCQNRPRLQKHAIKSVMRFSNPEIQIHAPFTSLTNQYFSSIEPFHFHPGLELTETRCTKGQCGNEAFVAESRGFISRPPAECLHSGRVDNITSKVLHPDSAYLMLHYENKCIIVRLFMRVRPDSIAVLYN